MARRFNGTSSTYLEYGGAVVATTPLTMACWFKLDKDAGDGAQPLLSIGKTANNSRVRLYVGAAGTSQVRAEIQSTVGGRTATALGNAKPSVWSHGCGVWDDNTTQRAYRDGRNRVAASGGAITWDTPQLTNIGSYYFAGALEPTFIGLLADAAIWNVALTDAEVYLLGQGYSPQVIRPGSLVAYWPLSGQFSPAEIDVKGRFDATVNGAIPVITRRTPFVPLTQHHRSLGLTAAVAKKRFFLIPS